VGEIEIKGEAERDRKGRKRNREKERGNEKEKEKEKKQNSEQTSKQEQINKQTNKQERTHIATTTNNQIQAQTVLFFRRRKRCRNRCGTFLVVSLQKGCQASITKYNGTTTQALARQRRLRGSPARSYLCVAVAARTIRTLLRLDGA
jgi:hypothetical protein